MTGPTFPEAATTWNKRFEDPDYIFGLEPNECLRGHAAQIPRGSHVYTADLLRTAFAALQIVELREYEADLSEGTQHHGRSALIGMVARKP